MKRKEGRRVGGKLTGFLFSCSLPVVTSEWHSKLFFFCPAVCFSAAAAQKGIKFRKRMKRTRRDVAGDWSTFFEPYLDKKACYGAAVQYSTFTVWESWCLRVNSKFQLGFVSIHREYKELKNEDVTSLTCELNCVLLLQPVLKNHIDSRQFIPSY
jgi:hypothetical protein